jgi:hypothetical protein
MTQLFNAICFAPLMKAVTLEPKGPRHANHSYSPYRKSYGNDFYGTKVSNCNDLCGAEV